MIVHVAVASGISLLNAEDTRRFKVRIACQPEQLPKGHEMLATIGRVEDANTAWIDVDALKYRLLAAPNPQWLSEIDAMVEAARPYGWISEDSRSVRAHIEIAE
jgi:hypothetical protein